MTNITINTKNHTIEMNKTTAKAASKFGTKAYDELQEVRRAYPNYSVVTIAKKASKPEYKGLSFDYMKKYIAAHDDENQSIMAEYEMLCATSKEGKDAMAEAASYADVKEWFLMTFPQIEKFHSDREVLLEKIAQRRAAKQAAKKAA